MKLDLDRQKLIAAGASPKLLARLDASPHRYFRALAVETSSRVCWELRDARWILPAVAVHGDAHVEQYVVTAATYGIEDYDQAGFGPAIVDLVRFGASLHLVCREVTWWCDGERATNTFLDAYRRALDFPPTREPPAFVDRIRRRLPTTPGWLAWTETLGQPLPPNVEKVVRERWTEFVTQQKSVTPDRPSASYELVKVVGLQIGIGSALETKLLFRVRGRTASPDDDLVIEARSITPPADTCVWRPSYGGSMQTLMFMSLLGPRMPEVFGLAALDRTPKTPEYWLQSWDPGYTELGIEDLESQADLEELAVDAAKQLAGAFWTTFPEPLRMTQRMAQLRAFDLTRERAHDLSRSLADEAVRGWEVFRRVR